MTLFSYLVPETFSEVANFFLENGLPTCFPVTFFEVQPFEIGRFNRCVMEARLQPFSHQDEPAGRWESFEEKTKLNTKLLWLEVFFGFYFFLNT